MRFYAACLASYNNGVLHGRWIDASDDVDAMQDEINGMLRESRFPNVTVDCVACDGTGEKTFHNSETGDTRQGACPTCNGSGSVPSAEEWAIHDFEGLPSGFGEYCGLQTIADYAEIAEEFDYIDESNLAKIYDEFRDIEEMREAMRDNFAGIHNSFRDYSDDFADEMLHGAPEFATRYFDYESFARDLKMDMRVVDLDGGQVAIFHD
ncbi:MAG: antirestriction protein ArdA [Mesorhizobium sp.]|nr:MAG: antirestriction protein ArdA [Mesorhizobium sp.]